MNILPWTSFLFHNSYCMFRLKGRKRRRENNEFQKCWIFDASVSSQKHLVHITPDLLLYNLHSIIVVIVMLMIILIFLLLRPDIDILRPYTDILWPDINILWPDIKILRPNTNILRPNTDILRPFTSEIFWKAFSHSLAYHLKHIQC